MRRRYLAALLEAARSIPPGPGVYHAVVLHDDECTPSRCVCSPEVVIEEATEENLRRGAEGQAEWLRKVTS